MTLQLVPRTYWSKYRTDDGQRWFCVWRMWLGRSYDILHLPVHEPPNAHR